MNPVPYNESYSNVWDNFCSQSNNATFLHTRKFINYHGNRFKDRSLIIRDNKNQIVALFPAAEMPDDNSIIVSHPGLTYGGLITGRKTYGETCIGAFEHIAAHYSQYGYKKIIYKAIPFIYHKQPSQDDIYALFRLQAKPFRYDLSATINLARRGEISTRRKRCLKKAQNNQLEINKNSNIDEFWEILRQNLATRHSVEPVHSIKEIKMLHDWFPNNIEFLTASNPKTSTVLAGIVLFNTNKVCHAQYITTNELGNKLSALDLLFEYAIAEAIEKGFSYFDFGICTENNGNRLNQGLYDFKHEFGAGGVTYEFYEIDI